MHEILYIQAGNLSNHIGTHFWNAQESYFTYDTNPSRAEEEEAEPELVEHDRSFREGRSLNGEATYHPRVLIFDRKGNFGNTKGIIDSHDDVDAQVASESLWQGASIEVHQDPYPASEYHASLANEDAEDTHEDAAPINAVRYWSDFSRVYFAHRSLQRLPDMMDSEALEGEWQSGKDLFKRYDSDTSFMEESFRSSVEECDLLQGIQITQDTSSFGSFIDSFLTAFRDDFPKLPSLSFMNLSDYLPIAGAVASDDGRGLRTVIHDALTLRGLNEMSDMNVPLRPPSSWPTECYEHYTFFNIRKPFHTSAVLSAHIESVTLPLRYKRAIWDISSLSAQLTWRGGTRFTELSGLLPAGDLSPTGYHQTHFSVLEDGTRRQTLFAQLDVSRGLSASAHIAHGHRVDSLPLREPFLQSAHFSAYPILSSFPPILPAEVPGKKPHRATSLLSTLTSTSRTAALFKSYASFVEHAVRRNADVGMLERDELRELVADLWTVHDGYADDDATVDVVGGDE